MTSSKTTDAQFLSDIVARTLAAGATDAEIFGVEHQSMQAAVRDGALEGAQRAEGNDIHLTAYVGKRRAALGTNQFDRAAIDELVTRVIGMAKIAPEDPYCGLAPSELVAHGFETDLELADPVEPEAEQLVAWAKEVEAAALSVSGVGSSDGASCGWGRSNSLHLASNGLSHSALTTQFGAGAQMIAGSGAAKETGSAGRGARWREDLPSLAAIGLEAGTNAARKVGARKIASTRAPVILDREVSMSLIGPLLSAINGHSIARGTSFLKDRMGQKVLSAAIDIIDEPHKLRGFGSRTVDGEGVRPRTRKIIDQGVLTTWLLDCSSARQLKTETTAHAGGFYNLTVKPGPKSQEELMRDAGSGLLVTYHFSPSLNPNSGDWSVGVAGFWFENGEIAYPVSEVTIACNLPELYPELIAGSDLEYRGASNAPSLLAPEMAIGGA